MSLSEGGKMLMNSKTFIRNKGCYLRKLLGKFEYQIPPRGLISTTRRLIYQPVQPLKKKVAISEPVMGMQRLWLLGSVKSTGWQLRETRIRASTNNQGELIFVSILGDVKSTENGSFNIETFMPFSSNLSSKNGSHRGESPIFTELLLWAWHIQVS